MALRVFAKGFGFGFAGSLPAHSRVDIGGQLKQKSSLDLRELVDWDPASFWSSMNKYCVGSMAYITTLPHAA